MTLRSLFVAVLLLLSASVRAAGPSVEGSEGARSWHRLVGILQYLEADYPAAVESGSEFELAEQRAFIAEALATAEELGPRGAPFAETIRQLQVKVEKAEEPAAVSAGCGALVEALVKEGGLIQRPQRTPDLTRGAQLYAQNCALCHAADGSGEVELAANMEPKPANFLDPALFEGLSPYKAYNTTSFGVPGTAMPAFSTLTEEERWSLGFFVFTLRQPPCTDEPPRISLGELASSTDVQLAQRYGAEHLACLRRKLPSQDTDEAFEIARSGVEEAQRRGLTGDFEGARQSLLDAYLMGLEPLEPKLSSKDPLLVRELETLFLGARARAEAKDPTFTQQTRSLLLALGRAEETLSGATPLSVFWLAFFILLREGFEAMVVVAALLAMLKKMNAPERARTVHLGWVSAAVAGVAAFIFGRHLISGTQREWVEGVVALSAVAMLLYAIVWLNARMNIRKHMGELRQKMEASLGRGSTFGLFSLAFMAAFRESFETALFLQGLALDSVSATAWGAAAGGVALAALVWMVSRVGYRLPMKALFNGSTVLLFVTAVILLGKGLRALQEVGALPLRPLDFLRIDVLGIYPDVYTLVPQLLLALSPLGYVAWRRRFGAPPSRVAGVPQTGA